MSQLKPILNVNSNFERGNVDGFTEAPTNTVASFLDRQDDRRNPKRRVFLSKLKASDYILNGRYSRRYTIASGGDIALTAGSPTTVAVAPGMNVAVDLSYRYNASPLVFTMQIIASNPAGTPIAYVNAADPQSPGRPFVYVWQPGAATINIIDNKATNYWTRIGFSVQIPANAAFLSAVMALTGQASESVLDVGEFSMQALDSVIHAIG